MNIFLICPVRLADDRIREELLEIVNKLESEGNIVYYPARDTDQRLTAMEINSIHLKEIKKSDMIYIYYISESQGIHFDMGMAFALGKTIKIVFAPKVESEYYKEFSDFIISWQSSESIEKATEVEEALDWCRINFAQIDFMSVHTIPRVRVKVGGYPYIERNSFLEAVKYSKGMLFDRRKI